MKGCPLDKVKFSNASYVKTIAPCLYLYLRNATTASPAKVHSVYYLYKPTTSK